MNVSLCPLLRTPLQLALLLLTTVLLSACDHSDPGQLAPCEPFDGLTPICGFQAPEDLDVKHLQQPRQLSGNQQHDHTEWPRHCENNFVGVRPGCIEYHDNNDVRTQLLGVAPTDSNSLLSVVVAT